MPQSELSHNTHSVVKAVKENYDPKLTLKVFLDTLHFNLSDIEQPQIPPPLCTHCGQLAASPVLSNCSIQLICSKCASHMTKCPFCNSDDCLRTSLGMMSQFVKPFFIDCPYSDDCDPFSLLDLIKHLETCPHTVYICGCQGKMKRDQLSRHYRVECPLRVQRCSYCEGHYHQKDMQQHIDNLHPQCTHCHEHHSPDDEQHMPQPCPVEGCERHIPPCSVKEHLKMVHSEHLFEETKRLKHESLLLIQEVSQLKQDKLDLQRQLEAKDEVIRTLQICKCELCSASVPALHYTDHLTKCEELHLPLTRFDADRKSSRLRLIDDGRGIEMTTSKGAGSALMAHSGLASGTDVVRWRIRWDRCSDAINIAGVCAIDLLGSLEGNYVGSSAKGVGLHSTGRVKIDGKVVKDSPLMRFTTDSVIAVTLDMNARYVTFEVNDTSYIQQLKHKGPHGLGVTLGCTGDRCTILSCERL